MKKGKAMKNVLITIISVSYNCKKDVEKTIESLKTQTYKNFEIHIYDNSCIEDSLSEVRTKYPEVKIQKNDKNLGFAGGNNSVLRKLLKDEDFKYLVLLNDDTQVSPEWLFNDEYLKTAKIILWFLK